MWPVKSRVASRYKNKKEKQQLGVMFDAVENLTTHELDWEVSGNTLQSLRESGITLPLTDALIAAIAIRQAK